MRNKFSSLILLVAILFAAGVGIYMQGKNLHWFSAACSRPIEYSAGSFDNRFGISQAVFLSDINQATQLWEKAVNKNLFEFNATGGLKINLVYDSRQSATDKLKSLGIKIGSSQSSYDSLMARYNSVMGLYNPLKKQIDSAISQYNSEKQAYEAQVQFWNSQGGAPSGEFEKLNAERQALNAQVASINQKKDQINQLVDEINALANKLNSLAAQLNLSAASYNTIGQSRGQEFVEGVYVTDVTSRHIDIYEFNDQQQLIRLLAHELGHSLGLEHVDDTKAIMYKLNEGANDAGSQKPTAADLAELNRICGLGK